MSINKSNLEKLKNNKVRSSSYLDCFEENNQAIISKGPMSSVKSVYRIAASKLQYNDKNENDPLANTFNHGCLREEQVYF